ncbi:MAG: M1 family aminopeptidase, partial [Vicinamibacterales bacterium]
RDYERRTIELFFTTPVGNAPWLLGRFAGGAVSAVGVGVAGVLGTLAGSLMPWVEQGRLAPFDVGPYAASFAVIDLPNLLIFSALIFSVAAVTRSQVWAWAAALGATVVELIAHNATAAGAPAWLTLLDPFGGLAVTEASRFWTVAELNTRLPVTTMVVVNRVVWLAVAASTLGLVVSRFRLELPRHARSWRRTSSPRTVPLAPPPLSEVVPHSHGGTDARALHGQFASQVRLDMGAVLHSPVWALVVLFTIVSTVSEFSTMTDALMGLALHPLTGLLLEFFRYGLFQFVLIVVVFYSALLVYRERDHRVAEIVAASPVPDWVLPVSKTATLVAGVTLLLLVSMGTSVVLQLLAGHRPLEFGVYLQGLFIYNGFYFWMLCVLAVVVQAGSPGRWSGMLLVAVLVIALLILPSLGLEHVLYGFRIPSVTYSDLNGFGHFREQTWSLIVYWGLGCGLLLVMAHLFFPRGLAIGFRDRWREAGMRATRRVMATAAVTATLFVGTGGWIYWNTNILNGYETEESRLQSKAAYEQAYGAWKNQPTPAFTDLTLDVALYPSERRLESRGSATLINRKSTPVSSFMMSADPRLHLQSLSVERAVLEADDARLGVRLYRFDSPLQPGERLVMTWSATRENRGFVNSGSDDELVENGTFVDLLGMVPIPAYDESRELLDAGQRRRRGLAPAERLPALGDPAWLNTLGLGIDGRMTSRITVSTPDSQIAVAPGVLTRQWDANGRRSFEYVMDVPVWPRLAIMSARYTVARDTWNGVALEVYHDAKHPWNVATMLDTSRQALAYYSREYAPYPLSFLRILEYPRYRSAARAYPGSVAYSESAGFLTDLRGWASLDYATAHEIAHQWWGGLIYGARMQGRQMLNETMAQYSTLMLFKQLPDQQWLHRILEATHRNYLDGRSRESVAEQPLMFTEDQGNISYNKGALAMFALQDLIGAERMHQALRAFLSKFAQQPPPYPTSRDLVDALRAVAGPEYQRLITDLFERVVLYDVAVAGAQSRPVDGGYEIAIDLAARQFEADGRGVEHEVAPDGWFDLVVFPESTSNATDRTPLSSTKVRLVAKATRQVIRVSQRPGAVAIDPFHLMIDRSPGNNVFTLPAR